MHHKTITIQNYYPFGMLMPTRTWDAESSYRFGFNGMEKDDEMKGAGNSYTTEFRQYDTRLGRWFSMDPLMRNFPWQSPYTAFDNNPILKTDARGDAASSASIDSQNKVNRQNKRFARLQNRLDKKFGKESKEYAFELLKRASKNRFGSQGGRSASQFFEEKGGRNSSTTGATFDLSYDNRKSELKKTKMKNFSGPANEMGIEGELAGDEQQVTFENVKDGEEFQIQATTMGGFQVQIFVNEELVDAFPEAPQEVTYNPDEAKHPKVTDLKTLTIRTGSESPQIVTISFRTVFTANGAKVHHQSYPQPIKISSIVAGRKLN